MKARNIRRQKKRWPRLWQSSRRCSLEPLESRVVLDSTLVFNELMYHPPDDNSQLEWVEFYNQMSINVDLTGWQIGGGISYEFAEGTIVPPGEFLVVASDPQALRNETGLNGVIGPFSGELSNGGERIELINNSGRIMNTVDYRDGGQWPVGPDGSGFSLAKCAENKASHFYRNWQTSFQAGGTPGANNFKEIEDTTFLDTILDSDAPVRALVPSNGNLEMAWTEIAFDDAGWLSGTTAVGYERGQG